MRSLRLKPVPPFRLDLTAWVLRRVDVNAMDRWDGRTYRRVVAVDAAPVALEVTQEASAQRPILCVAVQDARMTARRRSLLAHMLNKTLGLDIDLSDFYRLAARDEKLAELVNPFIGFKPPRFSSVFEAILNGIACQQVSLFAGIHLLNRLCSAFGPAVGENHGFPSPQELATAPPAAIRRLGFSWNKVKAIVGLAQTVAGGQLDLEALSDLDDVSAIARLRELRGIGRWTAEYVMLRGLGRLDVFPADDVGSQNKLQQWLKLRTRPDYDAMHRILDRWRPYRGLIYFHLLMRQQAEKGLFEKALSALR